jgi:hypothetical protein
MLSQFVTAVLGISHVSRHSHTANITPYIKSGSDSSGIKQDSRALHEVVQTSRLWFQHLEGLGKLHETTDLRSDAGTNYLVALMQLKSNTAI